MGLLGHTFASDSLRMPSIVRLGGLEVRDVNEDPFQAQNQAEKVEIYAHPTKTLPS